MIKKVKILIILFLFVAALFSVSQSRVYAGYCDPDDPGAQLPNICP